MKERVRIEENTPIKIGENEYLTLEKGDILEVELVNSLKERQLTFGFDEPLIVDPRDKFKATATDTELDMLKSAYRNTLMNDLDDAKNTTFDSMLSEYEKLGEYERDPIEFVEEYEERYEARLEKLVDDINGIGDWYAEYVMSDEYSGDFFYLNTESNYSSAQYDAEFEALAMEKFGTVEEALDYLANRMGVKTITMPAMSRGLSTDEDVIFGSIWEYGTEHEYQLEDDLIDTLDNLNKEEIDYIERKLHHTLNRGYLYVQTDEVFYWYVDKKEAIREIERY